MLQYRFLQRTKVLEGRGMIKCLPELLKEAGFHKPFLVFDQGIAKTDIIKNIEALLDAEKIPYVIYDQILPDPTADLVDGGAELCKKENCDVIIAIGGGSTMDAAKGMNVAINNPNPILYYVGREDEMKPASSLICIPTTAGTGSELSNWIVITDLKMGEKHPINVINSMCEYAILDPELTVGLPMQITAATGLDVFSHGFEAYTSTQSNIMTDLVCEKIMETVVNYLPRACRNGKDMEAREHMLAVAGYGGWMLVDGLVHIGHCIAHEIGAAFHIPHGAACAYSFPVMVKHMAKACPKKVAYTGRLLGADICDHEEVEIIAKKTVDAYLRFRDELVGLRPISDYKPDLTKVDLKMAERIHKDPITSLTPVETDAEDILVMLYNIFVK